MSKCRHPEPQLCGHLATPWARDVDLPQEAPHRETDSCLIIMQVKDKDLQEKDF